MSRLGIAVGVMTRGHVLAPAQAKVWLSLGHALAVNEDKFDLRGFWAVEAPSTSSAKNKLVKTAIDGECNWLVLLDGRTAAPEDDNAGGELLQAIWTAHRESAAAVVMADKLAIESAPDRPWPVRAAAGAPLALDVGFLGRAWPVPPWFDEGIGAGELVARPGEFHLAAGLEARGARVLVNVSVPFRMVA